MAPEARNHAAVLLAAITIVSVCLAVTTGGKRGSERFWVDLNGGRHGTGIKNHKYKSRALMLRENYVRGKLVKGEWFKPDGTPIQTTDWQSPETGEAIFLRQDGSIKMRMACVHGVAHGESIFYNEDGTIEKRVMYHEGVAVEP